MSKKKIIENESVTKKQVLDELVEKTESVFLLADIISREEMSTFFGELGREISPELMERYEKESYLFDRINKLKEISKSVTDTELEFLCSNMDILINVMNHTTDVERNYKYYSSVKKLIKKK